MKNDNIRVGWIATLALALSCLATGARAQDETTPLGHAPGAPAGAYSLSDLERINLFNGQMSLRLPLLGIGARGEAEHTLGLTIEAHWEVRYVNSDPPTAIPRFNRWRGLRPGYGPGTFSPYRSVEPEQNLILTRAAFTAGDLTQTEFRDEASEGLPQLSGFVRGALFKAHDGSQMTFVFDTPVIEGGSLPAATGRLLTPDGVQYSIQNGLVRSMKDRNGNLLRFDNYVAPTFPPSVGMQVGTITDSLNRVVSITYATPTDPNDRISFKGFGGAIRTVTVTYSPLSGALDNGEQIATLQQLFPLLPWNQPNQVHDPVVVSSVTLPNNTQYSFRYNSYGELAELTLPTGGYFRYTYGPGIAGAGSGGEYSTQIYRRLLHREVFKADDVREQHTVYGLENMVDVGHQSIAVQFLDALDSVLSTETHFFIGRASANLTMAPSPNSYPVWSDGREYKMQVRNTTTLLRTVDTTWQQLQPVFWTTAAASPVNEPRIMQVITTLHEANPPVAAKQTFTFNQVSNGHSTQFDNQTDVREYSFDGSTLMRRQHTDYVTAAAYTGTAVHLRRLPSTQLLYEGESTQRSRIDYVYDDYTSQPLVNRSNMTGHDTTNYGTLFPTRGNITRTGRWLDTNNTTIATLRDYDIAGNVVRGRDALGHTTVYDFVDRFGTPGDGDVTGNSRPPEVPAQFNTFAFPTETTNPASQATVTQFDYYLGKAVEARDVNGVISSAFFADPLSRLTQAVRSQGQPEAAGTRFTYTDAAPSPKVHTRADRDSFGDDLVHTATIYDSLGRPSSRATYEKEAPGEVVIFSDAIIYDARGRTGVFFNPVRSDATTNPLPSTKTVYDALGRITLVTLPDTAKIITGYAGNVTTTTDPAGKAVKTETDSLGRVTRVTEDPAGLNFVTTYAYDVFDHVTQVAQGAQQRSYAYDSLERLVCVSTPETRVGGAVCATPLPTSGVTLYTYDPDGNLISRKDARNVTTTMGYDALHRTTSKNYSGEAAPGTPAVSYTYDETHVAFAKGRLTKRVTAGVSTTHNDQYDSAGRVRASRQVVGANTFNMAYTYDLAGNLRTEQYPSGRVVTNTYDRAGRFQKVAEGNYVYGRAADRDDPDPFMRTDGYSPHGALVNMLLGNGLRQQRRFNCRLQQRVAGLGTSLLAAEILNIDLDYGTGNLCPQAPPAPTNNGNLKGETIQVNGVTRFAQSFTYDGVNRLSTASETPTAGTAWSQNYAYDPWGNRAVVPGGYMPGGPQTPTSLSQYDTASNRLNLPWQYDGAGNQTRDALARTFTYDAENRQTTFGSTTTYAYDGAGRRIKKTVSGSTTTYVYDALGRLVGEYGPALPLGTTYLIPDHLGTTRAMVNESAQVVGRTDYLPFGEEIEITKGSRSTLAGYGSDAGVRHKFTAKERDLESGLDFFQARYASAPQGRFTAADPAPDMAQNVATPSGWNSYGYVFNSPKGYVDPDGRQVYVGTCLPGSTCSNVAIAVGKGFINFLNQTLNSAGHGADDRVFIGQTPTEQHIMDVSQFAFMLAPVAIKGGGGRRSFGALDELESGAATTRSFRVITDGGFETRKLAELDLPKNYVTLRPTAEDVAGDLFAKIVGAPKTTSTGLSRGTIPDSLKGGFTEMKGGSSLLTGPSYQIRLQTFLANKGSATYVIVTSRPVDPAFALWLRQQGVIVIQSK